MSALGAWAGVGSTLCPPAVNGGPGEIGTISTTHTPATLNWSTTGWLGVFNAALVDQVDPGCNGARPWLACRVASQSPVTASLGRCIARDSLSHLHNTCHAQTQRFSSSMISCSPSIFRLLLPASGSPPLLVPQRHCTPSPPPLSLIHSSPLSQLPTISTSHELRLWQGGVGGQAGWETQVHWKLPRLAPPARRH